MKKTIIALLFSFFAFALKSQDTNIYVIRGKILDAETLKPIGYVVIINKSKMVVSQSDTAGRYRILMMKNDILNISCLGYKTTEWKLSEEDTKQKVIEKYFYLEPMTYPIGAVNIYALRWKSLVYAVKNLDVEEKTQQKIITEWISKVVKEQELDKLNPKIGIQIMIPTYSSIERQEQKIAYHMKIEEMNKAAAEKFNPDFVSNITGLKGEELTKFMNSFTFERDFILKTSEYDLAIIVKQIYEEYKNKKR